MILLQIQWMVGDAFTTCKVHLQCKDKTLFSINVQNFETINNIWTINLF
jgi:hypothetical protein